MNNTKLKVEFWKELWVDLIDDFLKRSYGFKLYSPQILVEDIITEIQENQFRNTENKKYFSIKVNEYVQNDEIIKSILKSEFSLLQKAIHTKKNGYILSLCKQINSTLKKGVYFNHTLKLAQNVILLNSEIDINFVNKINYYSQSLIVEFIKKTYTLEDIKKFVENIFDEYSYYKSTSGLRTKFPHQFDYKDFKKEDGKTDVESYEQAIKDKIENLTFKDRIKTLAYYYNKRTKKVKYIFVIRGLKGETDIDNTILGVHFYSVDEKKLSIEDEDSFKNLQRKSNKKEKYLQASVDVDYLMARSSSIIAKRKIETAIDILYCYFNIKTPISYAEYGYSVFDEDDSMLFSKASGEKFPSEFNYHFNSLDFAEKEKHLNDINEYKFLWNNKINNETSSKIKNALHWHRKAEQSTREEDKILSFWIALENLFNTKEDIKIDIFDNPKNGKIQLIQEIVSARETLNYIYDYGWELYWYYVNKKHRIEFPEELQTKAQLNIEPGKSIYLKKFVDNLEEIKVYESNLFILDKINSVIRFYSDFGYTKSVVIDQISNIKNDILMIYRLRNLIVHNAHYDNTLLPYYAWKAKTYCGNLLRKFIDEFEEEKTLSNIIFDIYIGKEKYLLDLDNDQINLFEND